MKRHLMWFLLLVLIVGLPVLASDSDSDGLEDADEALLLTDAFNPDSDGDGLADGVEYFELFTNPLSTDSDGDGVPDGDDAFPQSLDYRDLYDVTTVSASLHDEEGGQKLVQQVVVKVGDVITIDWTAHLRDFVLAGAEIEMSRDFIDPSGHDWTAPGYYAIDEETQIAEIVLPTSAGVFRGEIPWLTPAVTPSDWPYILLSKELEIGQTYEFYVFSHELLAWGEDPFFTVTSEVLAVEMLPIDLELGRREYEVYAVESTWEHVAFADPYFRLFYGDTPRMSVRAYFTVDGNILLRYRTPYFRVTPVKSVGFSDFFVEQ
ncbi:hypothetical protein ACFLSW_00960 [Candidatus Bipolaricaulota bacterium]